MAQFIEFPTRIFLDSSVLQTLHDYGDFIYENELPSPARLARVPKGLGDLEALQMIFAMAQRGPFEFALSENSLTEVQQRGDARYLQWAYDVLDHWEACIAQYGDPPFDGTGITLARALDNSLAFGYLSVKDRLLIRDAIALECDAFLTMEKKLPKNAPKVGKEFGLLVLRPTDCWNILRPWSALFV